MVEKRSLTLYWSKNGNTEKVARRIHDTLIKAGIDDSIFRMTKDLQVEYLDYNLVFLGAPVYENLPPETVIEFLKRHKRRGVAIVASAQKEQPFRSAARWRKKRSPISSKLRRWKTSRRRWSAQAKCRGRARTREGSTGSRSGSGALINAGS